MPWPRLKICGRPRQASSTDAFAVQHGRPPATSAIGSRLPCTATAPAPSPRLRRVGAGIDADALHAGRSAYSPSIAPARRGSRSPARPGGARSARHDAPRRLDHVARNWPGGSTPAQVSNSITVSAPASTWAAGSRWCSHQQVQQPAEQGRVAVGHGRGLRRSPRAAALDHVAGDRERAAGEPDQRASSGSAARRRPTVSSIGAVTAGDAGGSAGQPGSVTDRRQHRALAVREVQLLAQRPGQDQDVAEQDGRIEAEAPDRLQRDSRSPAPGSGTGR